MSRVFKLGFSLKYIYSLIATRTADFARVANPGREVKEMAADDAKAFNDLFDVLQEDLTAAGLADKETADAFKWFKQVIEYNVPHGKRNRGLTVVQSYRLLCGSKDLTETNLRCAAVVGWCIEWLQAYFLVADDVMDSSLTRRGQPCWYKVHGVGLKAINDAFFLESAVYVLLKKYLRDQPYYIDIVDLFHKSTLQTVIGQNLDLITAPTDHGDFALYTLDRYKAIVKYKTSFYSFYLPVASAMYMTGIKDEESHEEAKVVLLRMGEYFQIQDDYLDCYGDPEVTGKIGTDIEESKCSWLIVQALSKADNEQRTVLQENYGRCEAECIQRVKDVYSALKLRDVYAEYEEKSYSKLLHLLDELNGSLPKAMFREFASKIYKRQK